MSVEIIEELMDSIKSSPLADFGDIITTCFEYGFIEDIQLADMFQVDLSRLEDVIDDPTLLTKAEWNSMATKLFKFLKREKEKYDVLYYND